MSESSRTEFEPRRRPQRFGPHRLLGSIEVLSAGVAGAFCANIAVQLLFWLQESLGVSIVTAESGWDLVYFASLVLVPGIAVSLHILRGGEAFAAPFRRDQRLPIDFAFLGRAVVLISLVPLLLDRLRPYGERNDWWAEGITRYAVQIIDSGEWFSFETFVNVVWFFVIVPFILRYELGRIGALLVVLSLTASWSFVVPVPFDAEAFPGFSLFRFIEHAWLPLLGVLLTPRRISPWTSLCVALILSCRAVFDAIPFEVWILGGLMVTVELLARKTSSSRPSRPWLWPRKAHWALILIAALLPLALLRLMTVDVVWIAWFGPLAAYWMAFAYDARFGKRTLLKDAQSEG
jgi:hypothetical protein